MTGGGQQGEDSGRPTPDTRIDLTGLRAAALPLLPPPATLVGRTEELAALLDWLAPAGAERDGKTGTVVSAPGGTGKTALVAAAGAVARHRGWFCAELCVDLRGHAPGAEPLSAEEALEVLLHQAGVDPERVPPGLEERAACYRSTLAALSRADEQQRPVLVVADNARSADQCVPCCRGRAGTAWWPPDGAACTP